MIYRAAAQLFVLCALVLGSAAARAQTSPNPDPGWVIQPDRAAALISTHRVTILDTRGARAFARAHVPGAVHVEWTQFSQRQDPNRGKLLEAAELQSALRAVGIDADRSVIVVGDPPHDWGEDGRIVWMLRAAGHSCVGLVNGGFAALVRVGVETTSAESKPAVGTFEVHWDRSLVAIRDQLEPSHAVILDTREPREYRGATPYGESRGGHVEGAKNLYFKTLMNRDGTLLSVEAIRKKLAAIGVHPDTEVIAYCTGGVRSGWMVAVLRYAGFTNVRNYAGSMWDWAAAPAARYPLVRD